MTEQTPTPENDTTDDVEAHGRFRGGIVADSDDVEGHAFRRGVVDEGDDVEGHMPFKRYSVGDDVESGDDGQDPGFRVKF